MLEQIKKFWQIIVVIFILGGTWATTNYKVGELEKRVEKLEKLSEIVSDMKAELKSISRERWRRER